MRTSKSSTSKVWVVALRRNSALGYRQGIDDRPRWMGVNLWLTTAHFDRLVDANPLDEKGLRKVVRRVNRGIARCAELPAAKRRLKLPLWYGELTAAVRDRLMDATCRIAVQVGKHLKPKVQGLDSVYGDLHIITMTLDQMAMADK